MHFNSFLLKILLKIYLFYCSLGHSWVLQILLTTLSVTIHAIYTGQLFVITKPIQKNKIRRIKNENKK